MVNIHFVKILLGKQSYHQVFINDSYVRLEFRIFAWLGLNPDYAPAMTQEKLDTMPPPLVRLMPKCHLTKAGIYSKLPLWQRLC